MESEGLNVPDLATFVYGPPKEGDRRVVWNALRRLAAGITVPWLALGDFNDLLSQSEKEGGNPRALRKILNFQSLLSDCSLLDLEFKGSKYTWCNKRCGAIVRERIDRALGNVEFRNEFEHAIVFHIDPVGSDHHALVIDCCHSEDKAPSTFKFEANWVQHEDFLKVVDSGWKEAAVPNENSLIGLIQRLDVCRRRLTEWSRREFPNFRKVIDQLRRELCCCYEGNFTDEKLREAENLVTQIEEAWKKEEIYWWQRSRISWLKCGDKNTKFFHSSVIQRRMRNKILRLKADNGGWLEDRTAINKAFSDFYRNLFCSVGGRPMDQAISYVKRVVSDEDNICLMKPVTDCEIEEAMFQLGANKEVNKGVNKEVCDMVKGFFAGSFGLREINFTNLILIPKVEKAEGVHQFRPIGLCNVTYKVIAKILTNRMQGLMDKIISPNQRGFIAGRMIQDNIILTHEAFHYLKHKKTGKKWELALKIDMNKAYDRVEWDFLMAIMLKMGFDEGWVGWIRECIASATFTVKVDGHEADSFQPERGLRQGDPLSPYMFIIASEVLSLMLHFHVGCKDLTGIKLARRAPILSHCFFADDAILFLKADMLSCNVIKRILEVYCKASGQLINIEKSSIFFSSNTPLHIRERVSASLGIPFSDQAGKYLGLPTIWGRSKAASLAFVRDKIGLKLQGWRQKLLSFAGREVLIKAVANSIPTYPMACFLFPKKSCVEIDSLISKFWWGQQGEEGVIHWKSWKHMTMRKGEGGMGFRELLCFNKALLAKTAWRLLNQPNDPWCKTLKGIYFPKENFLRARKGRHASWGWSSLLVGRDLLLKELLWKVGNGRSISLWKDPWIQGLQNCTLKEREGISEDDMSKVESLIVNGRWDLSPIVSKLTSEEIDKILSIPIPVNGRADRVIWLANRDGIYTVKSGYAVAKNSSVVVCTKDPGTSFTIPKHMWKGIWKVIAPPKIQHFMWRLGARAIATREALYKRKCSADAICPVCLSAAETIEHLLFLCPWTKHVWFGSPLGLRFSKWSMRRCEEWLCDLLYGNEVLDDYGKSLFATICWWIWKKRCNWVFKGEMVNANVVVRLVNGQVEEFWGSKNKDAPPNKRVYRVELTRKKQWEPPPEGSIKINIDGSFKGLSGEAGIGVVCRDCTSSFVGGMAKTVEASSPFMAECLAMKEAINHRHRFGNSRVIFESDCECLIKILTKENSAGGEWHCHDVLDEIFGSLESVKNVSLSLVARQGNCVADRLATEAAKKMHQPHWLDYIPSSISNLLIRDSAAADSGKRERRKAPDREGIG